MKHAIYFVETAITLTFILVVLSWMGEDQIADEAKSAEVLSNAQYIATMEADHQRKQADLIAQGVYMTSFDKIAKVSK